MPPPPKNLKHIGHLDEKSMTKQSIRNVVSEALMHQVSGFMQTQRSVYTNLVFEGQNSRKAGKGAFSSYEAVLSHLAPVLFPFWGLHRERA